MPFPLTDGGAIGIFNITKSLAELGHEITLLTFPLATAAETSEGVAALSKYADVRLVSRPLAPRWQVLLRTLFRGAYPIERRETPEMYDLIASVIGEKEFDVVHVDHAHMGRYGLWIQERYKLPIVLREHNFEALIYERFAQTETNALKRFVAQIHGRRLKREEAHFLARFDAIAAISDEDVRVMKTVAPDAKISVIPAGVDTEYFQPSTLRVDENSILSVGPLGWDPNFDALRYFLESIFPTILRERPQTVLHVVGSDSERAARYAKQFGEAVILHGRVPDIRDYFARSAVVVIPLRIGGGMRVKLLELFAAGKAVVSTSIGAEGNRGEDNVHLMLRNDAQSFASAVVELLDAPALRNMLGQNARELAIETYSWSHIASEFTSLYECTIARREAFINAQ